MGLSARAKGAATAFSYTVTESAVSSTRQYDDMLCASRALSELTSVEGAGFVYVAKSKVRVSVFYMHFL